MAARVHIEHGQQSHGVHIILFLLSTGTRLNEALRARWEHIDVERRIWRIPATNSKSRKVRAVPLNDSAIGVLNRLDTEGKLEHVFINRKNGPAEFALV
jgi:integrase